MPHLVSDPVFTSGLKVIPVCALVNLAITMLAALLPLRSAAKITPIQGIRDISNMRVMKQKKIKSTKHFSMPKLMAKRSLMFYKGGRIAVTLVLVVSIVISCYGFSDLKYAMSNTYTDQNDYTLMTQDYRYGPANWRAKNKGYDQDDLNAVQELPHITELVGLQHLTTLLSCPEYTIYHALLGDIIGNGRYDFMSYMDKLDTVEEMKQAVADIPENEFYQDIMKNLNRDTNFVQTDLVGIDETGLELLKSCVLEGDINAKELSNGNEVLLLAYSDLNFGVSNIDDRDHRTYSLYATEEEHRDNIEPIISEKCFYHPGERVELSVYFYEDEDQEVQHPSQYDKTSKTLTVGAILDPNKFHELMDYYLPVGSFVTTTAGMKAFCGDLRYSQLNLTCEDGISEEQDLELTQSMMDIADQ